MPPTQCQRGLCACGCGKPTKIATRTNSRWGHVKGQPIKFINGHNTRLRQGETSPNWRGDKAGYVAAHERLGPVGWKTCVDGGEPAVHWSLRKDTPPERLKRGRFGKYKGLLFSLDPADYEPRCVRCHRTYDAKLTTAQVLEIRRLLSGGTAQRSIAKKFGVSRRSIRRIGNRKSWSHLPDPAA